MRSISEGLLSERKKIMFEIKGKINTAICYTKVVEEEAIEQIRRMCENRCAVQRKGQLPITGRLFFPLSWRRLFMN